MVGGNRDVNWVSKSKVRGIQTSNYVELVNSYQYSSSTSQVKDGTTSWLNEWSRIWQVDAKDVSSRITWLKVTVSCDKLIELVRVNDALFELDQVDPLHRGLPFLIFYNYLSGKRFSGWCELDQAQYLTPIYLTWLYPSYEFNLTIWIIITEQDKWAIGVTTQPVHAPKDQWLCKWVLIVWRDIKVEYPVKLGWVFGLEYEIQDYLIIVDFTSSKYSNHLND